MTVLAAIVLFANFLFAVIAWPRFYPRIAADPRATDENRRRTAFYRVHLWLIAIALALGVVSLVAGILVLLP